MDILRTSFMDGPMVRMRIYKFHFHLPAACLPLYLPLSLTSPFRCGFLNRVSQRLKNGRIFPVKPLVSRNLGINMTQVGINVIENAATLLSLHVILQSIAYLSRPENLLYSHHTNSTPCCYIACSSTASAEIKS